jgi:hypothetical protein
LREERELDLRLERSQISGVDSLRAALEVSMARI